MLTILKGRLIDGITDTATEHGLVAFDNDRILYAGDAASYPGPHGLGLGRPDSAPHDTHGHSRPRNPDCDCRIYDVGDDTILPGFIDCHAHLTGDEDAGSFCNGRLFGDQLLGAAYQLSLLLEAGFTSLRDMSEAGLYLSRAVSRGILTGPRIVPGGRVLGITSGHVDMDPSLSKEAFNASNHLACLADGPDECTRAVREQFRAGAKFIKICATGGVSSPTDRADDVQFSPEELCAIVSEAKRHHSYVAAHCTGYEGAYQALLAGVECIEHGVQLTQREIDLMAQKDIPLVSTLWIALNVAKLPGFPDWMRAKTEFCAEANKRTIAMARAAKVRIALGTDFSNSKNTPYLKLGREFEAMVEAGMTPMEAIQAGTAVAASVIRNDEVGVLREGMLADIVVARGNPLEDISTLADAKNIRFVCANGKVVKNSYESV